MNGQTLVRIKSVKFQQKLLSVSRGVPLGQIDCRRTWRRY